MYGQISEEEYWEQRWYEEECYNQMMEQEALRYYAGLEEEAYYQHLQELEDEARMENEGGTSLRTQS